MDELPLPADGSDFTSELLAWHTMPPGELPVLLFSAYAMVNTVDRIELAIGQQKVNPAAQESALSQIELKLHKLLSVSFQRHEVSHPS